MNILKSLTVAGLASFGMVNSVSAYDLHPHNHAFTALGQMDVLDNTGRDVTCVVNINGRIGGRGIAKITGVSFVNVFPCPVISVSGLPWTFEVAPASGAVVILNVALGGAIGPCGPARVFVDLSNPGIIGFKETAIGARCVANGFLRTTPAIRVGP